MGQLTYAQMRLAYLQGTGDSPAAQEESYLHLSEGLRYVSSQVDVPESLALDESVVIKANTDRILTTGIDFKVYSISSISNTTDGTPMYPEPNGMDGRRLYLIAGGLPPTGNVVHWVRDGDYLFVRYMPTADTTLRIHGRRDPDPIAMENINEMSPLPSQYDWTIIRKAILNFKEIHPDDKKDEWLATLGDLRNQIAGGFQQISPRAEEDRTIRSTTRLRGYSPTPRSIRRV
jgi:hypothetical protein